MPGDLAYKLAQHAKRTLSLPHLPPYQTELILALIHEIRSLDKTITQLLSPPVPSGADAPQTPFNPLSSPATACSILVYHLSMRRAKRCLLAYHRARADRVAELCWRDGRGGDDGNNERSAAEQEGGKEGGGGSMSPEEEDYGRRYGELVAGMKGRFMDVDLAGSLEPPRELFVDVRVLRDAGEIQTEYGAITLTKNSQFFVRQGDVERLIAQGYLQKLS